MTKEESNAMIAIFMDGVYSEGADEHGGGYVFEKHPCNYIDGKGYIHPEDLFYHIKLDWLHPVVQKIWGILTSNVWEKPMSIPREPKIYNDISVWYEWVVKVITWINENKTIKTHELGNCMENGCNSKATKDYNGHKHYVCDSHYKSLSNYFDAEYK